MGLTPEEEKAVQKRYYSRLNEILVRVQDETISRSAGEDEIYALNNEFPNLYAKASTSIIEAMTNEYSSFDEGSMC